MDAATNTAAPTVMHQPTLLGGAENMKLLFDDTLAFLSENRKAYASLQLRAAEDAQTIKHFANLAYLNAQQTGDTANQQTVSPIRTGAADNVAAGATPANRITDTSGAVAGGAIDSATAQATLANVTAQVADLVTQVASLAALIGQMVTNAGTAGKQATS